MEINEIEWCGLKALECCTSEIKWVIPLEFGPRISFFGKKDGHNLLFWDLKKNEKELLGRGPWKLRGGHRLWITRPGADEGEETYFADNEPVTVKKFHDGLQITGIVDPQNKIQKSMRIKVLSTNKIEIDHELYNTGTMLWSGGAWALTCTLPKDKTHYGIPLGDNSTWDIFNQVVFRRWGENQTSRVNDDQIYFTEDCLCINPKGVQAKRMIESRPGIIGMTEPNDNVSFIKKVNFQAEQNYPLNTNIAFYIGPENFMVEMETMSPEKTIKPGDSLIHQEIWSLTEMVSWNEYSTGDNLGF